MIAKQITLLLLAITINLNINASYAVENTAVGTVTLAIGQTQATNKKGQSRILKRTGEIFIGDTIKTNQNSHLHIKFIDNGRISIRPESHLYIEDYHYDPINPEKSAIRFFLEHGVLRSISGQATEAAHGRYRMNTPIAALGVLGTDYLIRTSNTQTLAAVYSGSIALSPLNQNCMNSSFGACSSATILTAKMSNTYLEVNLGENKTQLKSHETEIDKSVDKEIETETEVHIETETETEVHIETETETEVHIETETDQTIEIQKTETISTEQENTTIENMPNSRATENGLADNAILGLSPETPKVETPKIEVPTPTKPIEQPMKSIFTWARWTPTKHSDDHLSQTLSSVPEDQKITIGNEYIGLFRKQGTIADQRPETGVYNFNLKQSHVVFIKHGQTWQNAETAQLNKAALQIDFGKRQINTQLEMSTATINNTQLNITGNINNSGIFIGSNNSGKISGALSPTGSKAGMIFEKPLINGTFNGISEWQKND